MSVHVAFAAAGTAAVPVSPRERLARIETDPNLRHSGARWRAHEAVFPGRGAAALAENYTARDAELRASFQALLAELLEKAPDETDEIAYCEWALSELGASTGETTGV